MPFLASASPMPVPAFLSRFSRWNGSKMRSRNCGAMPGPLSWIVRRMESGPGSCQMRTCGVMLGTGELEGIGDKVENDLFGEDEIGSGRWKWREDFDDGVFFADFGIEDLQDALDDFLEVDCADRNFGSVHLGVDEEVVNEAAHHFGRRERCG